MLLDESGVSKGHWLDCILASFNPAIKGLFNPIQTGTKLEK
jgi:hypothetical protein